MNTALGAQQPQCERQVRRPPSTLEHHIGTPVAGPVPPRQAPVAGRALIWPVPHYGEYLAPGRRVLEVLSEHLCQGWLQGYLLTGQHGLLPCYEAFAAIDANTPLVTIRECLASTGRINLVVAGKQ